MQAEQLNIFIPISFQRALFAESVLIECKTRINERNREDGFTQSFNLKSLWNILENH